MQGKLPILEYIGGTDKACAACSFHTWHDRLDHGNPRCIHSMARNGLVDGLKISDKIPENFECPVCAQAKQHNINYPRVKYRQSTFAGQLIHSDVAGPFPEAHQTRNRYAILFMDDYTEWIYVYFMVNKSDAPEKFEEFLTDFFNDIQNRSNIGKTEKNRDEATNR